jgi:hypothetical protein
MRQAKNPLKWGRTLRVRKGPFPEKAIVSLTYGDVINMTATSGVPNDHRFVLNNVYDPDLTGSGHQPRGYDELKTLYKQFTVIGAAYKVTFTGATSESCLVSAIVNSDSTILSDYKGQIEESGAKYTVVQKRDGGPSTKVVTGYVNMNKFFGENVLDGDEYDNTASTGPGTDRSCFLHLMVTPTDLGTSITDFRTVVEIRYIVQAKQLLHLTAS